MATEVTPVFNEPVMSVLDTVDTVAPVSSLMDRALALAESMDSVLLATADSCPQPNSGIFAPGFWKKCKEIIPTYLDAY